MGRLRQLLLAARLLREGRRLGDGALLKADALGARGSRRVAPLIEPLRGYLPRIDLDALAALPEGTLGRAYARHMRENGLMPLEVSAELDRELVRRNVFAVRYAVTHDVFHLLLGFDTRWPGEMGVLAFAAAQGYSAAQKVSLVLAALLYPLFAPRLALATFRALRRGWSIGKRARCLLAERFEERWAEPLERVRRDLGLPDPTEAV
jgi:ubiquinone biosynthesis protein Coq4